MAWRIETGSIPEPGNVPGHDRVGRGWRWCPVPSDLRFHSAEWPEAWEAGVAPARGAALVSGVGRTREGELAAGAASKPVLCGSIASRPGRFGVAMHTAAFRALGLDFAYVAFGCEDTAGAVAGMRALGLRGLGVTMPHKQRIAEFLDELAADARAIGAVNTVVNDAGWLVGHNVDWSGAIEAFREAGLELAGLNAAVVGAGGGGRAIAYGLMQAGARVSVFNRDAARGRAVADALGCSFAGPPDALAAAGGFGLIAHATPVGFHDPDAMLPLDGALRPGVCVFDAVPMPVATRLLRAAAARGCRTIAGVRMQLHQAARQFELYTGRPAPLAVMDRALAAAIARPAG